MNLQIGNPGNTVVMIFLGLGGLHLLSAFVFYEIPLAFLHYGYGHTHFIMIVNKCEALEGTL